MKRIKILVFEYITGGGLNQAQLPESLVKEGLLMLQALLNNLAEIESVDVVVMLDERLRDRLALAKSLQLHSINADCDCRLKFRELISSCDAVWPIAPESDGLLLSLCEEVERHGKYLLTSSANAVTIGGNKWLTYERLRRYNVNMVKTEKLNDFSITEGEWIIKPKDGVGCELSFVVESEAEFAAKTAHIDTSHFIIQPHLPGKKISLSCLFKQGKGWLLSVNLQEFKLVEHQYKLTGIHVNYIADRGKYQHIVNDIGKSIPDLWGYVGIDLIETDSQVFVLEINPRLTTSYAGISRACGINVAQLTLQLLSGEPLIHFERNQPVTINIEY